MLAHSNPYQRLIALLAACVLPFAPYPAVSGCWELGPAWVCGGLGASTISSGKQVACPEVSVVCPDLSGLSRNITSAEPSRDVGGWSYIGHFLAGVITFAAQFLWNFVSGSCRYGYAALRSGFAVCGKKLDDEALRRSQLVARAHRAREGIIRPLSIAGQ